MTSLKRILKKMHLLVLLLIVSLNAFCQSNLPALVKNNYTFKELGWDDAITLNSYNPSAMLYLPITNKPRPQTAILHLKIAFSQELTEATRLEIKFNQTLLRTISPSNNSADPITLDIELPLSNLSADWQGLSFTAYLNSKKTLCSPELWIYILPDSSLTLTTTNAPFTGSLNQVMRLFLNDPAINPSSPLLLLPATPSLGDIFASLRIAMRFGQLTDNNKIVLSTHFIDQPDNELNNHNLVLIGTESELQTYPPYLNQLNQKVQNAFKQENGIILLSESPLNPQYGLLTFTASNYKALNKAVRAFLLPEFQEVASGQLALIKTIQTTKNNVAVDQWYQTTLEHLDYNEQMVTGLGQHKVSYSILLPTDKIPQNATLETLITSPLTKQEGSSYVTLLVNGQKQSSFELSSDHFAWKATINASALKPGFNTFEYVINLHLAQEECTLQNYEQVWATIHNQTKLTVFFLDEYPMATLNQFPVPFSSEINVIVPEQLSKNQISNLGRLFFKFGQLIPYNVLTINFLSASQIDEAFIRTHNLILYGTPESNPWVKFALEYMPIQLKNNERVLKLSHKYLELGGASSTGLLELMHSPWSSKHAVFLLTGTEESGLNNAVNQFINDEARVKLNGNIALINADRLVEVFNSHDGHYISKKEQLINFISNKAKNIKFYLFNHPQLFIYLLVFIVPVIIYLKRRKK